MTERKKNAWARRGCNGGLAPDDVVNLEYLRLVRLDP
jgi:hypothetical protein